MEVGVDGRHPALEEVVKRSVLALWDSFKASTALELSLSFHEVSFHTIQWTGQAKQKKLSQVRWCRRFVFCFERVLFKLA